MEHLPLAAISPERPQQTPPETNPQDPPMADADTTGFTVGVVKAAPSLFDKMLVQVERKDDGTPKGFKILRQDGCQPMDQKTADFLNGHYTGYSHFTGHQYYPKGKYQPGGFIDFFQHVITEQDLTENPELVVAGVEVGDTISMPADALVEKEVGNEQ